MKLGSMNFQKGFGLLKKMTNLSKFLVSSHASMMIIYFEKLDFDGKILYGK